MQRPLTSVVDPYAAFWYYATDYRQESEKPLGEGGRTCAIERQTEVRDRGGGAKYKNTEHQEKENTIQGNV